MTSRELIMAISKDYEELSDNFLAFPDDFIFKKKAMQISKYINNSTYLLFRSVDRNLSELCEKVAPIIGMMKSIGKIEFILGSIQDSYGKNIAQLIVFAGNEVHFFSNKGVRTSFGLVGLIASSISNKTTAATHFTASQKDFFSGISYREKVYSHEININIPNVEITKLYNVIETKIKIYKALYEKYGRVTCSKEEWYDTVSKLIESLDLYI